MWYLMGVVLSAGGAFAWYRDQLAQELLSTGAANERLNAEAATIPPGAEGVTFLPYLQGERTPHRDASMRAAFLGLSLAHSRAHLTRAVIEGVCFALRDSVSILAELGLSPNSMLLTGGGARVPLLRRLQSEIFGVPVCTVNREEGPAYGAALLAAVGAGAFPDLQSAAKATLLRGPLEKPDPAAHSEYEKHYQRFRASYGSARSVAVSAG
jgi:xylulokinase